MGTLLKFYEDISLNVTADKSHKNFHLIVPNSLFTAEVFKKLFSIETFVCQGRGAFIQLTSAKTPTDPLQPQTLSLCLLRQELHLHLQLENPRACAQVGEAVRLRHVRGQVHTACPPATAHGQGAWPGEAPPLPQMLQLLLHQVQSEPACQV